MDKKQLLSEIIELLETTTTDLKDCVQSDLNLPNGFDIELNKVLDTVESKLYDISIDDIVEVVLDRITTAINTFND